MVKAGYAVIVVERPGTGASFGHLDMSNRGIAREINDVLNWIAAQKWCDGNIGMYGDSDQARVQFVAASTGNPHLKAILPASTWMDNYTALMYPGGIYDKAFGSFYVWTQKLLDSPLITPVDTDPKGVLMDQARAERRGETTAEWAQKVLTAYPYRDSLTPSGQVMWDNASLSPFIDRINKSGIPVYVINGWYDLLTRDNFLIYANLTVPKRMLVRPTDHSDVDAPGRDIDFGAEAHRWFDHWLKGIDNGIEKEPPIHYSVIGARGNVEWRSAAEWPPKDPSTRLYFGAGGFLEAAPPALPQAADAYTVDYSASTGKRARWTAVNWSHEYPNLRSHDSQALVYTTPELESGADIVGHPILHLWLSSDASDLDVFAYLEEVDPKGNSTYITEGCLRASHRALGHASFDYLGLPYHAHLKSEVTALPPGTPVELSFDLLPTAYRITKGNRIRVAITCSDADNFETPVLNPAPRLLVRRETGHASFVEMPLER